MARVGFGLQQEAGSGLGLGPETQPAGRTTEMGGGGSAEEMAWLEGIKEEGLVPVLDETILTAFSSDRHSGTPPEASPLGAAAVREKKPTPPSGGGASY